jgi:hypothetical protein
MAVIWESDEHQIVGLLQQLLIVEQQRLAVEQQLLALLRAQYAPVGFRITETALPPSKHGKTEEYEETYRGEANMTIRKAGVDLQILDDGKGVLFTLVPVNHAGAAEPLPAGDVVTGVSSAPASLANPVPDPGDPSATPPRPADTTGLVFLSTVVTPVVDATDIVVTFSAPFGSTAANPVDVVSDNSPVGFTISESAL